MFQKVITVMNVQFATIGILNVICIDDDKLLEKYKTIWIKTEDLN